MLSSLLRRLSVVGCAGVLVVSLTAMFVPGAYAAQPASVTRAVPAETRALAGRAGLVWQGGGGAARAGLAAGGRRVEDWRPRPLSAATVASTPVGIGPGLEASDVATDTIYVADSENFTGGDTISVIDGRTCQAADISRCMRTSPTVTVGNDPMTVAVDETTDTVYVANGNDNTVSVIDGATCNAHIHAGCSQSPPTVSVGANPQSVAVDDATHTAYVANGADNTVSMIDTSTCNASDLGGCAMQSPPTVGVGVGPIAVAVNPATHTVYVANDDVETGNNDGDTLSAFDASTCNATTQAGCHNQGTATVGVGPFSIAIDTATNSLYTANEPSNTVSVLDGRTCDAVDLAGCAAAAVAAVTVGSGPVWAVWDGPADSLYVVNTGDDTVSVIATDVCNGQHMAACSGLIPPTVQAGEGPNGAAVDPATHTLYVTNGIDNDVSVIATAWCDATDTSGCRHPAPTVADNDFLASVDPATNTIYAGNNTLPEIDVLNGATCNARDLSGCAPVAEIPMADPEANVGAVDDATHTLYAADPYSDTVSVINTATCNAAHTKGCSTVAPTITVGPFPGSPALDPVTRTLYLPYGSAPHFNKVAVVNTATCNAEDPAGCATQKPGRVTVGPDTFSVAVSAKTDTVYAPSVANNTMAVINGATCNGTDHSGCKTLAATVNVGAFPLGVAVDDVTHTVYVANDDGDSPGTVSMINSATCNSSDTDGCSGPVPTVGVGRGPELATVDPATGVVYITDSEDATVSVLYGSRCNATATRGCGTAVEEIAVGSSPAQPVVDPDNNTVYVTQPGSTSGSISILETPGCNHT